jgi:thymidine kinase
MESTIDLTRAFPQKTLPGIYTPGFLEVFAGNMRSSKTFQFYARLERCAYANIEYLCFQPAKNSRDEGNNVTSRTGVSIPAYKIEDPAEIFEYITPKTLVIGIEEAHLFPPSIATVVNKLLLHDFNIPVSGLDMDSERRSFAAMDYFLREADIVHKLHAVCEDCHERLAKYSFFKGGKQEQIAVGDSEYMMLCRPCYAQHSGGK